MTRSFWPKSWACCLGKNLFAEKRLLFARVNLPQGQGSSARNEKEEDLVKGMQAEIGQESLQSAGLEELKRIQDIQFDTGAAIGGAMYGQKTEKTRENPEPLDELLRELDDYNYAIDDSYNEISAEADILRRKLLGEEEEPVLDADGTIKEFQIKKRARYYPAFEDNSGRMAFEKYGEAVENRYDALRKARQTLRGQEDAMEKMDGAIQQSRSEIEQKKQEEIDLLKAERQAVLEKIKNLLEKEKEEVEASLRSLARLCQEPEMLKLYQEDRKTGGEMAFGFLAEMKKRIAMEEILRKLQAGDLKVREVQVFVQTLRDCHSRIEEKKAEIERLLDIRNYPLRYQALVENLSTRVNRIGKNFQATRGRPVPESLQRQQAFLQQIRERLNIFAMRKEAEIKSEELVFIESMVAKFETMFGKKEDIQTILQSAEQLQALEQEFGFASTEQVREEALEKVNALEVKVKKALRQKESLDQAIPYLSRADCLLGTLWGDLNSMTQSGVKSLAFSFGYLDATTGEIQAEQKERCEKLWTLSKLQEARNLENLVNQSLNATIAPPPEEMVRKNEIARLHQHLADLVTNQNPEAVIAELHKRGNLEIVDSAEFKKKYKDTGITNSYFVIEQINPPTPLVKGGIMEYQGDVATSRTREGSWTIYLDAGVYEQIKQGETGNDRFRARIAHELGHREFDANICEQLKQEQQQELYNQLAGDFKNLIGDRKVGTDSGEKTMSDSPEHLLSESWALLREHQVKPLPEQGKDGQNFKAYIEKFAKIMKPQVGDLVESRVRTTVRGAEKGTEEEDEAKIVSVSKGAEVERSEKELEEVNGTKGALEELKDLMRIFGVKFENGEEKEEKKDKKDKKETTFKIADVPKGEDEKTGEKVDNATHAQQYLDAAIRLCPGFEKRIEDLNSMEMADVRKLKAEIEKLKSPLQTALDLISKERTSSGSYLSKLWEGTRFLSFDDVHKMFKESWEFAQRRRNRNAEDARASVGHTVFGNTLLGNEYLSKKQSSELTEVGKYKDSLKNMSYETVYPLLYAPKNRDHLRAIISRLSDWGRMRWDDQRIWKALYKFTLLRIPNEKRAENDIQYRNEWLKQIFIDIWDENMWEEALNSNEANFDKHVGNFKKTSEQLHNKGAVPTAERLNEILEEYIHKLENGEFPKGTTVIAPDPEYYSLLSYAWENGKLTPEHKFFYMLEGVRNRLMTVESFQSMHTKWFPVMPNLDFFYAQNNTYKAIVKTSDQMREFAGIKKFKDKKDFNDVIKKGAHRLLHSVIATNNTVKSRISKRTADLSKVDHDDIQSIIPTIPEYGAENIANKEPMGSKGSAVTPEGVKNALAGIPTFLRAQASADNPNFTQIAEVISTFVKLDGYVMQRIGADTGKKYHNFKQAHLQTKISGVPSDYIVRDFQKSMYRLVEAIFAEYYKKTGDANYAPEYTSTLFKDNFDGETDTDDYQKSSKNIASFYTKMYALVDGKDRKKMEIGKEVIAKVLKEQAKTGSLVSYRDKLDDKNPSKMHLFNYGDEGEDNVVDYKPSF